MGTRKNRRRITRRGGGPKKNKSSTQKKESSDRELKEIINEINNLNDGINNSADAYIVRQLNILVGTLERMHNNDDFSKSQIELIDTLLEHNNKMMRECLPTRNRDCNFLRDYINRIEMLKESKKSLSGLVKKAPRTKNIRVSPEMKKLLRVSPELKELVKVSPELVKTSPEMKELVKTSPEMKELVKVSPELKELVKTSPEMKELVKTSPEMKELVKTSPEMKELVRTTKSPLPKSSVEAIIAELFVENYLKLNVEKLRMTNRFTQTMIEHLVEENNRELEELAMLKEQMIDGDMCDVLTSLFPSFSTRETPYRKILCNLLFLIGKISYIVSSNYAFGACDYYILVKGGTALKLMANHSDFKYDSEDIDITIMNRPTMVYDENASHNFAERLINYCKWFIGIKELNINSQTEGLGVKKLYYNKKGLCDVDYMDHSSEATAVFYENTQTIIRPEYKILFKCQTEEDFLLEKEFLYKKYEYQCMANQCHKEENKKKPECLECEYLKKKFEKPIKSISKLRFLRR